MNKRTVVLLIITVGIWIGVGLYYLGFFTKEAEVKVVAKTTGAVYRPVKVTPEFLESYTRLVSEKVESPDLTTPFFTSKGEDFFRKLIVEGENVLRSIGFSGYIISKGEGRVFLKLGGNTRSYNVNEMIQNRYIIVYTSSIGIVVLDSKEGGLLVIK